MEKKFLVYAYLREDGTFYYIGKGNKNRPYNKRKRKYGKTPESRNRILILCSNLTEKEAFSLEKILISVYGRKGIDVEGILENRCPGGEVVSGYKWSEEQKKVASEKHKGFKHSEDTKRRLSESRKGSNNPMFGRTGEKSTFYGRKHTDESKKKISDSKRGKPLSEEHKRKVSEGSKGRIILQEQKYKISSSNTGKIRTEEQKIKMSKLRNWYHPTHGIVMGISATQMPHFFPGQNLKRKGFSDIASGNQKSHRGWIYLTDSDVIRSFLIVLSKVYLQYKLAHRS
jgi:hypothetical protein